MMKAYLIKCALSAGSPLQAKMTHPFTQQPPKVWTAWDQEDLDKRLNGLPPAVKAGPLMAGIEHKKAQGVRNALLTGTH